MLIYIDEAFVSKINGFKLNEKDVKPINKDKHNELREEQKYPCITWQRLDKVYDYERYINGLQEVVNMQGELELYELPDPYNVMYQLEIVAKERYAYDMLEMFIDSSIRPRGDSLPIECFIESTNSNKTINFPMRIVETKQMDELDEPKNIYYRRVYTISVKMLIDLNILKETAYQIKEGLKILET